jgi:hypothetical protein
MQRGHIVNAGALTLIMKKLLASAYGAATSTLVTTPRPKRSTSYISAQEHRKKFAKQRNRGWRGSIRPERGERLAPSCHKRNLA